jgi:hypothetical protein
MEILVWETKDHQVFSLQKKIIVGYLKEAETDGVLM